MIRRPLLGAPVGGGLGRGWRKLVGRSTGGCPLTGDRHLSTLGGMIAGALLAGYCR